MMLEIALGLYREARAVEKTIDQVLRDGYRTPDIFLEGTPKVTTMEMGTLTVVRLA